MRNNMIDAKTKYKEYCEVKLTVKEKKRIKLIAIKKNMTISDYLRSVLFSNEIMFEQ